MMGVFNNSANTAYVCTCMHVLATGLIVSVYKVAVT